MIRKLEYNKIHFGKYAECLRNSQQKNWYARKEILDHLSGNWHILVYNDYEAVMPIHIQKKMGINFVHMPLFCQQLGIFSKIDNPEVNQCFLNFLTEKYRVFFYTFNDGNGFEDHLEKKKNYIIPVSEYPLLRRKKYFKGRKSTVKAAQHLTYQEIEFGAAALDFIKNNFKGLTKEKDWEKLKNYLSFLSENNTLKLAGAFSGNTLINLALMVSDTDQLSLLGLMNHEQHKEENGASFLIDKILQEYIAVKSFNFMGSNIRGIEVFFKSFGAELREYGFVENKFLKRFA
ncbi:hypothetical protein [uncultured Chryseobacterium sp.]|uniref:hypothetical protein n=1 Tax=uncultured Chryseobacterium sp. TaxID=259322 RepID=UPI0025CBF21D|nr:hypothetical protein [uncultured Chryseobacterium sp.]